MNKAASLLKPLMPFLSALYGIAIIYVTALPLTDENPSFVSELLTWLITLAGIALTLFLVRRAEPELFPAARQFSLKFAEDRHFCRAVADCTSVSCSGRVYSIWHYVAGLHFTDGTADLHSRRAA